MKTMNLYSFCTMFYDCKEIQVHAWKNDEDGNEVCEHFTCDRFSPRLYGYREYEVIMFKSLKKGVIEVYASNFTTK